MTRITNLFALVVLLLGLLLCFFTLFKGIVIYDEGYIVNSAQRILDGQVIYRDFHFAYTPGSVFFNALWFRVFGSSLAIERIGIIFLTFVTCWLIFLTGKIFTSNKLYLSLLIVSYLAWGPTHINFFWPVMFSIPIGLAVCYFLIKATESKKHQYIFAAGIFSSFLFLFKQNFGIGIFFLSLAVLFYFPRLRKKRSFVSYFAGALAVSLIFFIYLVFTNSLISFGHDMYDYTVQRIIFEKALDTKFFYGDNFIQVSAKALLYLFPLYTSLIAFFILFAKKSGLLVLPVFCVIFYVLGIRPTTDFVHLTPLFSITGIPLIIILHHLKNKLLSFMLVVFIGFFIAVGFYTAYFFGYYRWEKPLNTHHYYLAGARAGIWVSADNFSELEKVEKIVNKYASEDKYIFVFDYQPMIYYINKKKNPTKFDLVTYNNYFLYAMPEVIKSLVDKRVNLIVSHKNIYADKSILAKYILTNYELAGESEHFYFFKYIKSR